MEKQKTNVKQKADIHNNPSDVEHRMQFHHEKEKGGRFIAVPKAKPPTMIFVREGRDEKALIERYIKRRETKQVFKR